MDSSEAWQRVFQLFPIGQELQGPERQRWLASLSETPTVIDQLEAMLNAHTTAEEQGFLDRPLLDRPLSDDQLGQVIDGCTLIRRLGSGGVGEVYLGFRATADSPGEQVPVAVKILHRRFVESAIAAQFEQERLLLATMQHSSIVPILDHGMTAEGLPYLVMEFVDGMPLDQFANFKIAGMQQRLNLFRQLCDAVAALHAQGILHLDLKPANVLVQPDGQVRLLDFGIARLQQEGKPGQASFHTAGYSSPEQQREGKLTTASDIYSLGVLLYTLLSGRQPLAQNGRMASSVSEAMISPVRPDSGFRIPVPMADWIAALETGIDKLVAEMLRERPSARPHSVALVSERVLQVQRSGLSRVAEHVRPARLGRKTVQRFLLFGVLICGVAFLSVAGWMAYNAYSLTRHVQGLIEDQDRAVEALRRMPQSDTRGRQKFVETEIGHLESVYREDIPAALSGVVAPRRQVARYAVHSINTIAQMYSTVRVSGDLLCRSMALLQRIETLQHDTLRDTGGALETEHHLELFRASGAACGADRNIQNRLNPHEAQAR